MSDAKDKILITGASGFLGGYLMRRLSELAPVIGLTNSYKSDRLVSCDITDRSKLWELLDAEQPTVIVHAAAMTRVDECETNPEQAHLLNVEASRNIAKWAANQPVEPKLVYISTDQLYSGDGPHHEADPAPGNVYAATKKAGEDAMLASCPKSTIVLRTNMFGLADRPGNSLVDWLITNIEKGAPITLFTDSFFSPLYIEDLADVVAEAIEKNISGVFNAGCSGGGLSKADFGHRLIELLQLSDETVTDGVMADKLLSAARPNDMRLNSAKLENALGHPLPTIEQGFKRLAALWLGKRVRERK